MHLTDPATGQTEQIITSFLSVQSRVHICRSLYIEMYASYNLRSFKLNFPRLCNPFKLITFRHSATLPQEISKFSANYGNCSSYVLRCILKTVHSPFTSPSSRCCVLPCLESTITTKARKHNLGTLPDVKVFLVQQT